MRLTFRKPLCKWAFDLSGEKNKSHLDTISKYSGSYVIKFTVWTESEKLNPNKLLTLTHSEFRRLLWFGWFGSCNLFAMRLRLLTKNSAPKLPTISFLDWLECHTTKNSSIQWNRRKNERTNDQTVYCYKKNIYRKQHVHVHVHCSVFTPLHRWNDLCERLRDGISNK